MAFQEIKSERRLYDNDVRRGWAERLANIHGMAECTALLREFRTNHIGPERTSYRLYNDALWIENAIEQRLAQLKAVEMNDEDLLSRCTSGETAQQMSEEWARRVESAADVDALEALATDYRRRWKPPIMPVNAWLRGERLQMTKLMVARGERSRRNETLEELRASRGAKLVGGRDVRTHRIRARFEDGQSLTFECGEHEDVISAALREQINLLSQCREGQCATCKATCASGEAEAGEGVNVYSLPQEEQDQGLVLLCQTYPRSDLELEMPYGKDMVSFGGQTVRGDLTARIYAFERRTPGVRHLVLEHINPSTKRARELSYTPGQYLNLQIPGTDQWRSFSLAVPPRANGILEFFVKDIAGGLFSEEFWSSARVGLELSVQGPFGMFHINRHSGRPRCFLAGGTGIAPILAMVRQMRESQDPTLAKLIFAVSEEDAGLCEKELADLLAAMPNLTVERSVGRSGGGVLDRFQRALSSFSASPDVYLCGPEGLVVEAEGVCRSLGLSSRQIYAERFLPSGPARHAAVTEHEP